MITVDPPLLAMSFNTSMLLVAGHTCLYPGQLTKRRPRTEQESSLEVRLCITVQANKFLFLFGPRFFPHPFPCLLLTARPKRASLRHSRIRCQSTASQSQRSCLVLLLQSLIPPYISQHFKKSGLNIYALLHAVSTRILTLKEYSEETHCTSFKAGQAEADRREVFEIKLRCSSYSASICITKVMSQHTLNRIPLS